MQQPVCLNDFKMSIPKSRKRAMEDSLANPGRVYWLMDKVHVRILTYDDPEKAKAYAQLLYNQALLIAGLPLDDPSGYTDLVCGLMQ